MPQGALKKKKPAVEKKIQKREGSGQKKKGLQVILRTHKMNLPFVMQDPDPDESVWGAQSFKPRKPSLSDKLNRKLTSEIRNNIEKATADRFRQGGGKLGILKL
jgi:hypothetical protein